LLKETGSGIMYVMVAQPFLSVMTTWWTDKNVCPPVHYWHGCHYRKWKSKTIKNWWNWKINLSRL